MSAIEHGLGDGVPFGLESAAASSIGDKRGPLALEEERAGHVAQSWITAALGGYDLAKALLEYRKECLDALGMDEHGERYDVQKQTHRSHRLKTWPLYYQAIIDGTKTFEVRKDDRDFRVGDVLNLDEWDQIQERFTGRRIIRKITYIIPGGSQVQDSPSSGIKEGFVVMGFEPGGDGA